MKKFWFLFLLVSILNVVVFLFRDAFQYIPFASYADLYGRCEKGCIETWKGQAARYTKSDYEAGRRILDTVLPQTAPTTAKAAAIASFLYNNFHRQIGFPNAYMQTAQPLQQYVSLSRNKSLELWCGNFGTMFFFFCWAENIPCRAIEIINKGQHHIVNEFYDEQSGTWIFADAMSNLFLLKSSNGQYLNLVDFIGVVNGAAQAPDSRFANKQPALLNGRQVNRTYYSPQSVLYYYRNFNKEKVYSTPSKIQRYFLPVSWYKLYSQPTGHNILFYSKLVLFVCWLVLLLLVFRRLIRKRMHVRKDLD